MITMNLNDFADKKRNEIIMSMCEYWVVLTDDEDFISKEEPIILHRTDGDLAT